MTRPWRSTTGCRSTRASCFAICSRWRRPSRSRRPGSTASWPTSPRSRPGRRSSTSFATRGPSRSRSSWAGGASARSAVRVAGGPLRRADGPQALVEPGDLAGDPGPATGAGGEAPSDVERILLVWKLAFERTYEDGQAPLRRALPAAAQRGPPLRHPRRARLALRGARAGDAGGTYATGPPAKVRGAEDVYAADEPAWRELFYAAGARAGARSGRLRGAQRLMNFFRFAPREPPASGILLTLRGSTRS